jgi:3-dehydroquinate dehydratase/shikimate dehydrogenase
LLTTSILAAKLPQALAELREAESAGADAVELRLDFLDEPLEALPALLSGCRLPAVVTFRAAFEQPGRYDGPEDFRLRTLWRAVELGAAFVDVELKAAASFFAMAPAGWLEMARAERATQECDSGRTRIILSSHDYAVTPVLDDLLALHDSAVRAGADIVKIATTATSILDVGRLETLLSARRAFPTIALGMGEYGLVRTRAQRTT